MADVQPLRALHYDLAAVGSLDAVCSPPYDVIDPAQRAELASRSPYNVVRIDLPEPEQPGGDPYAHAATQLAAWREAGAVVRDEEPALWALTQTYTGPDGATRTRNGFLARVRVEDYGPGRIRPHERTHPGPKEDRLRLTRATQANLSPIFSLYGDPAGAAWGALAPHVAADEPFGEQTDPEGTRNRLFRITDPDAIAAVHAALEPAELLIADGHHRYETARVYAEEIGGEGEHSLRPDAPRRARGSRSHGLPHAPPDQRARRRHRAPGGARRDAARVLRRSPSWRAPTSCRRAPPPTRARRSSSATSTGTTRRRTASRSRTRRSPTARSRTSPSPTGTWTRRSSRASSSPARSASPRTTSPTSTGSATRAATPRRSSGSCPAPSTPRSSCRARASSRSARSPPPA